MEAVTAAKLVTVAVKNKDSIGKYILIGALVLVLPFLIIMCCFLKLISAFTPDGAVSSTAEFDATQTAVYQAVQDATKQYYDSLWEEMTDKKNEIINENTETITINIEGIDYETDKCDAIVTRRLNYLGDAYLIAYLAYTDGIDTNTAFINADKATEFLSAICKITVSQGGYKEYEITNVFLSMEEIAEQFFLDEAERKEFQSSCYAYSQFFDISGSNVAADAGNYTDIGFSSTKLMEIPLYLQYKGNWANVSYGNGNIKKNGCCPTCLAMVFSYLRQETIYPNDVTAWAGNRYYVNGQGTAWSIFNVTNEWGVKCSSIGKNPSLLTEALREGKPVIASMGPGTFTKGGHFIVLSGITADGKIRVKDPNDSSIKNHANTNFDLSLILRESKNMWVCEVV